VLAGMIAASETDLICDLAETYGVMDYKALPLKTVAALSSGLRDNSRSKMRITGRKVETEYMMGAAIIDHLATLIWMQSKDGHKGRNRPESLLNRLIGQAQRDDIVAFNSVEEFEAARKMILGG